MSATTPHTPSTAKGYDDSPPRNGTIFFYTILTVFLLVCVKFLLDSYFVKIMDGEIETKVLTQGMEEVAAMRAAEAKQQGSVDAAVKALAARGRAGVPQVAPKGGENQPEVTGWSQLPRKAATSAEQAAPNPPPAPEAPAPEVAPAAGPGGAGAANTDTTESTQVKAAPSAAPGADR